MSQILVRDMDPQIVERLKQRALRNRRSLEAEVRLILEDVAEREARRGNRDELLRNLREIRAINGPQTSNSLEMIREDRDR
jgi:plasmid stability protein